MGSHRLFEHTDLKMKDLERINQRKKACREKREQG